MVTLLLFDILCCNLSAARSNINPIVFGSASEVKMWICSTTHGSIAVFIRARVKNMFLILELQSLRVVTLYKHTWCLLRMVEKVPHNSCIYHRLSIYHVKNFCRGSWIDCAVSCLPLSQLTCK